MKNNWCNPDELDAFIDHPSFAEQDPAAEAEILGEMPDAADYEARRRAQAPPPHDMPPEMAALYKTPLLSLKQQRFLFRKMNYLKAKARRLRAGRTELPAAERERWRRLTAQALEIQHLLTEANLRLVVPLARRYSDQAAFADLLSIGFETIHKCTLKFDFGRGFAFSTYASNAVKRNFFRSLEKEQLYRQRGEVGLDDVPERPAPEPEDVAAAEEAGRKVRRLLAGLNDRERRIVRERLGLDGSSPATLEDVGQRLRISKERVRQLYARALLKLQHAAAAAG
jgi:RNA polymerase sigma factor (sigma-70 family)